MPSSTPQTPQNGEHQGAFAAQFEEIERLRPSRSQHARPHIVITLPNETHPRSTFAPRPPYQQGRSRPPPRALTHTPTSLINPEGWSQEMNLEAAGLLGEQSIEKTLKQMVGKYPELMGTNERLDQLRAHLQAVVVFYHG